MTFTISEILNTFSNLFLPREIYSDLTSDPQRKTIKFMIAINVRIFSEQLVLQQLIH